MCWSQHWQTLIKVQSKNWKTTRQLCTRVRREAPLSQIYSETEIPGRYGLSPVSVSFKFLFYSKESAPTGHPLSRLGRGNHRPLPQASSSGHGWSRGNSYSRRAGPPPQAHTSTTSHTSSSALPGHGWGGVHGWGWCLFTGHVLPWLGCASPTNVSHKLVSMPGWARLSGYHWGTTGLASQASAPAVRKATYPQTLADHGRPVFNSIGHCQHFSEVPDVNSGTGLAQFCWPYQADIFHFQASSLISHCQ